MFQLQDAINVHFPVNKRLLLLAEANATVFLPFEFYMQTGCKSKHLRPKLPSILKP